MTDATRRQEAPGVYEALKSEENRKYERAKKSRSRFPPAETRERDHLNADKPVVVERFRFGNGRVPALRALPELQSAQWIRVYPDGTVEPAESPVVELEPKNPGTG